MDQDAEPGQYRVHAEEIIALDSWLRTGTVRRGDCSFMLEGRGDGFRAFESLVRDLREAAVADKLPPYVYASRTTPRIRSGTFPLAATVHAFAVPPTLPPLRSAATRQATAVHDPASATATRLPGASSYRHVRGRARATTRPS